MGNHEKKISSLLTAVNLRLRQTVRRKSSEIWNQLRSIESYSKLLFILTLDHKVNSMPKHAFTAVYSSIYESIR